MRERVHVALLAEQREDELASYIVRRWQCDRNSCVNDRLQVERCLIDGLLLILFLESIDGVADQSARCACCRWLAAVADVERRLAFVASDARASDIDVAVGVALQRVGRAACRADVELQRHVDRADRLDE